MNTLNKFYIRKEALAKFFNCNEDEVVQLKEWGFVYEYKGDLYKIQTRRECKYFVDPFLLPKEEFKKHFIGETSSEFGGYYIYKVRVEGNKLLWLVNF